MRSKTHSVTLQAPADKMYAFLSNPANLPKWAVAFCKAIRRDGDQWLAETPMGTLSIRYVTDKRFGIIDIWSASGPGTDDVAHSRIVPNGEGSEYIFTFFQAPGLPDDVFEAQEEGLKEEFVALQEISRHLSD
jgi:hypothetical protein